MIEKYLKGEVSNKAREQSILNLNLMQ